MVLETQQWLNKTYGTIAGFSKVTENGQTGWPTIYALREGLQHELGISPVASGYGPATESGVSGIISKLKPGYKGNIVKLIQGAFWCKGINPEDFTGNFSAYTKAAIATLQKNAGLSDTGVMSAELMKALFDMSAFTLVSGGNATIRSMQQYLNNNYHQYFGILPCDGIYQRDTNTALIYALQAVEGMSTGRANGVYGPGTITNTPTLYQGDTGAAVKVLQYGLMVNDFYNGPFDGKFTSSVASAVIAFRKFMNLPPFNTVADLKVIKGLLTSNGDTSRDSIACDTSRQLTDSDVALLKRYGFSIVGRYLTGTVGVGSNETPKNLTGAEIQRIINGGLSIFPIYQDGGGTETYFTASRGTHDALKAQRAALSLGFPQGSTIYFAVDTDIVDGNIPGTVMPYINSISSTLSYYKVGIYGTRNVCAHAMANGAAVACFVSDMSTGYSGNLGFKMPTGWTFDQFIEYSIGSLPIDQVAASGKDMGANNFNVDTNSLVADFADGVVGNIDKLSVFGNVDFQIQKQAEVHLPGVDYYLTLKDNWSVGDEQSLGKFTVSNGKVTAGFNDAITQFSEVYKSFNTGDIETAFNKIAPVVGNGVIEVGLTTRNGFVGLKLIVKSSDKVMIDGSSSTVSYSLTVEMYIHPGGLNIPTADYNNVYEPVNQGHANNPNWVGIGAVAVAGVALIAGIMLAPEFMVGAGVALAL